MSAPSADAFIGESSRDRIAALATLYDRFAHALDPFSPQRDEAERVFVQEVSIWYDSLPAPKPSLQEFRKAVILRCKRHLLSLDRPSSI
jgi:hypothetical protein